MGKIDLDKILDDKRTFDFLKGAKRTRVKVAMREACNQALDEAAKRVRLKREWASPELGEKISVDKQSILEIKEEL